MRYNNVGTLIRNTTNDMKSHLTIWSPFIFLIFSVQLLVGQQNAEPTGGEEAYGAFQALINERCASCHSGRFPDGGFSFDTKESLESGGDSGGPILSPDRSMNEIWKRVTHPELAVRMPKNDDALSEEELAIVSRWIETGAYWPDTEPSENVVVIGDETSKKAESWFIKTIGNVADQLSLLPHRIGRILILIGICLLFLLLERWKKSRAKRGESGPRRWWEKLNSFHLTSLLLFFLLWNFAEMKHYQSQDALAKLERLKQISGMRVEKPKPIERVETGIPVRIRHKKSLAKTYYRGNCEHNDALYNQGNYRTATFELWLSDTDGNRLEVGDRLPDDQYLIQLEMTRAKGAAKSLFTPNVMNTVFATTNSVNHQNLSPNIAQFKIIEPFQKWQCTIPVQADEHPIDEPIIFHICKGDVFEDEGSGKPHYGLVFEADLEEGKLTDQSDLWMGNLLVNNRLIELEANKIPPGEWFDVRPIPEIEGENTDDPELIGTPEHLSGEKK